MTNLDSILSQLNTFSADQVVDVPVTEDTQTNYYTVDGIGKVELEKDEEAEAWKAESARRQSLTREERMRENAMVMGIDVVPEEEFDHYLSYIDKHTGKGPLTQEELNFAMESYKHDMKELVQNGTLTSEDANGWFRQLLDDSVCRAYMANMHVKSHEDRFAGFLFWDKTKTTLNQFMIDEVTSYSDREESNYFGKMELPNIIVHMTSAYQNDCMAMDGKDYEDTHDFFLIIERKEEESVVYDDPNTYDMLMKPDPNESWQERDRDIDEFARNTLGQPIAEERNPLTDIDITYILAFFKKHRVRVSEYSKYRIVGHFGKHHHIVVRVYRGDYEILVFKGNGLTKYHYNSHGHAMTGKDVVFWLLDIVPFFMDGGKKALY